jgi:hypothetical protein
VAIDLDQPGTLPGRVLVGGHDFFCTARLSPDASRMTWLAWDHPNMPWNGTTLYLRTRPTTPADARVIARCRSVFQPEWSPDGISLFRPNRMVEPLCTAATGTAAALSHAGGSACRNGILACRHTPRRPGGSYAPIRRRARATGHIGRRADPAAIETVDEGSVPKAPRHFDRSSHSTCCQAISHAKQATDLLIAPNCTLPP